MKQYEENNEKLIPKIHRQISDFLYEEEGNISRGKILTVGSLLLIAGILFSNEAFAAHRSHSSHSSHRSHSSHSSHKSHSSHSSGSHYSHSSHSNSHSSHSNVLPNFNKPQTPLDTPVIK